MSETKNDESGDNEVEYEDVDVRTGDEILRSLGRHSLTYDGVLSND